MSGILVTGAARGIGEAIAQRLAGRGELVGLVDVDAQGVVRVARSGAGMLPFVADATDPTQMQDVAAQLAHEAGGIRALVNNAGGFQVASALEDTTTEEWDSVVRLNLRSVFVCSRAVVPWLRAEPDQARIVNVASVAGRTAVMGASLPYAAAKAGVVGLTQALAVELAGDGIAVNAVAPGLVATERVQHLHRDRMQTLLAQVPAGRFAEVREIAGVVEFLLGPDAGYLVGAVLDVNGGRIPV